MRHSSRWLAVLAVAASSPAFADATVYTNSATFLASLQAGYYTETFNTGGVSFYNSPLGFSGGGFSYTVSTPTTEVGIYRNGAFLGSSYYGESMTITFTGGGVTSVGGNFYLTNQSDVFVSAPVTLTLSDGTTTTFTPTTNAVGSYAGFASSTPITSLTISAPAALQFNAIDNLTVGVSPVPEAGTFALMALGLGFVALRRQNR